MNHAVRIYLNLALVDSDVSRQVNGVDDRPFALGNLLVQGSQPDKGAAFLTLGL